VSSAGVALAASTWPPLPAPDSTCWGSGGAGSGKATSSSTGGGGCTSSAPGCSHDGSGDGVPKLASGSSNPSADGVLPKSRLQHLSKHVEQNKSTSTTMAQHLQSGLRYGWHLQL
jgi:hypothetical protein